MAYSMLPISSVPDTLPATRMEKMSPRPWSKRTSGATRESEHERIVATGTWPVASVARRALFWWGWSGAPETKRALPSVSCLIASSAETKGASAPNEEAMLMQKRKEAKVFWRRDAMVVFQLCEGRFAMIDKCQAALPVARPRGLRTQELRLNKGSGYPFVG